MKFRCTSAFAQASLIASLAACATSNIAKMESVPEPLKVPETQVLTQVAHAVGVQIYDCQARQEDPSQFAWILKAPEAVLSDRAGKNIGRHYAGPSWEANDGSKVVGDVVARDNGPDANAIPWLLLKAKSTSGKGLFGQTQYIQRLHTVGGKAPTIACDRTQNGREERVSYSGDYYFYVAKS
jgi:hypothetical protein